MGLPQWLQKLLTQNDDTGRICEACGGKVVSTLDWTGAVDYCRACGRVDRYD